MSFWNVIRGNSRCVTKGTYYDLEDASAERAEDHRPGIILDSVNPLILRSLKKMLRQLSV